jgi:release factor H-coupled RctB family protein
MNTIAESQVRLVASARSWIEGEALQQLLGAARLPGVRRAVGLPDLHPGLQAPVGAAFAIAGMIYPRLIGGDIGCGMALFKTGLPRRKARLDRWAELRFDLEHPWEGNVRNRLASEELSAAQFGEAFGTLGGGDHFAELQAVESVRDREAFDELGLKRDELVALVHSGSRGLGQVVLESYIEEHGASGAAADSDTATGYLLGHDHAVNWAAASRELIAERFVGALGGESERVLDSCHNSIACRECNGERLWLHRKGATPADRGPVVIPGTRGTFSYLVQPVGEQSANAWSLPHGAGRKWSRSESRQRARERFHYDELVQTRLGGRVICEERDLLYEEAPMGPTRTSNPSSQTLLAPGLSPSSRCSDRSSPTRGASCDAKSSFGTTKPRKAEPAKLGGPLQGSTVDCNLAGRILPETAVERVTAQGAFHHIVNCLDSAFLTDWW